MDRHHSICIIRAIIASGAHYRCDSATNDDVENVEIRLYLAVEFQTNNILTDRHDTLLPVKAYSLSSVQIWRCTQHVVKAKQVNIYRC